jgi:LAO/AO transport system kinase
MNVLLEGLQKGNIRSLARLISKIENEDPQKDEILKKIYPLTGKAGIIGVTGSPGAGKSSLVDSMTAYLRKKGDTVGIIAVDPTSPFSGGAILGDRIRMQQHAVDKGVYIRSMGTRGSLGGLARTTKEAVKLVDAFGFDWVIIETVGVGQAELDVMHVADTTLVVMNPGAGDSIQTIKAGIMEIADIFVVNKCDLPGADRVVAEISQMLDLQKEHPEWRPPVVKVSTLDDRGVDQLIEEVNKHLDFLKESGRLEKNRGEMARKETLEIVDYRWRGIVDRHLTYEGPASEIINMAASGKKDPYTAAGEIMSHVLANSAQSAQDSSPEGGELMAILESALRELGGVEGGSHMSEYRSYLHGQVYGLATALKLLFPGPGNFGEKAAMALRPVITEHSCRCGEEV